MWSYDGRVPGVTLENRLPVPTTIHWHGVRVPDPMDGVPGVTQAAIEPGQRFTYDFIPPDAGTYWFHSHVHGSEQVERGLQGVLVVEDARPLPWSQDVVWVVDDRRIDRSGQIDRRFDSRHDVSMHGRWGNTITANGKTDTVLAVRPGQRNGRNVAVSRR